MTAQSTAIIFKTITGKWAFKCLHKAGTAAEHYRVSNGCWASKAYAAKVAKDNGFMVEYA